ncbi:response regulator [bacterium]|nr:MAG: response regulator [bacterium]
MSTISVDFAVNTRLAPNSPDILLVDDEEANRVAYDRTLSASGYTCAEAANASEARAMLQRSAYLLVILDINMPGESGLDLLTHIRTDWPDVAVVMVTGVDDPAQAMKAIEMGAYGYMVKPVRSSELMINVANALFRRSVDAEKMAAMQRLEATVRARTKDLVGALDDLKQSQSETILRLAKLVEFRDEETGRHVERMSHYSRLLARKLGLPESRCAVIQLASQLHDVGKVSVPDGILFKPGKLAPAEFEVMKGHAEAGYRMLANSESEVIQVGATIARTHHERWDGSGYPRNLSEGDIPLEGRIAAVADVFDALTSRRGYRSAFPPGVAVRMIGDERGRQFDPHIVNVFLRAMEEVEVLRQRYED